MIVNNKKVITGWENRNVLKFPAEWTKQFELSIVDFNGQWTDLTFNTEHVTAEEFLNKVSHCKIEKPKQITRREAQALKQKIFQNKNKTV